MKEICFIIALASLFCAAPCSAKPQQIKVAAIAERFVGNRQDQMEDTLQQMLRFYASTLPPKLAAKPDLVVFSECIDLPCNLASQEEKTRWYRIAGPTLREYFRSLARDHHCYVVYPHLTPAPNGGFFNTAELFDPAGEPVGQPYYKQYLPLYEQKGGIVHGTREIVWDTPLGRITPLICFDLNFVEMLPQIAALKPDLIVFPSWYHGGLMQNYWAYRCGCYFIGAYSEEASIVDPLGRTIARGSAQNPDVIGVLNPDFLQVHWDHNGEKLAAAKAKYGSQINYTEVDHLGVVLLSSSIPGVTAEEVAREFKIVPWRDYYAETVTARLRAEEEKK